MEIFRVDRSKLRIPETTRCKSASMLDDNGMSCILGLYGLFNHVPKYDLKGMVTPRHVYCKSSNSITRNVYKKFICGDHRNTHLASDIMSINDTHVGGTVQTFSKGFIRIESLSHRESLIEAIFAGIGIQVEFFGELSLVEDIVNAGN